MCIIFQLKIFCPLLQAQVKNEVEKEHFPELWVLADTKFWFWLQGALREAVHSPSDFKETQTQESKEKLLRKGSYVTDSCCRASHNCSGGFYQVINPCRMLSYSNNYLPQPDCSPGPSIWLQDMLRANSTFTEHISIRGAAGVQQQQKMGESLVLITVRTKRNKCKVFASNSSQILWILRLGCEDHR